MSELADQPTTNLDVAAELGAKFGPDCLYQNTVDNIPTFWVPKHRLLEVMRYLKTQVERPYPLLLDLSAIDERLREHRLGNEEEWESAEAVFDLILSVTPM